MERVLADALDRGEPAEVYAAVLADSERMLLSALPDALTRAATILTSSDGTLTTSAAWRLGFGMHLNGRFGDALAIYRRADDEETSEAADRAELHAAFASSLWGRAEADECARHAALALEHAEAARQPRALASALLAIGLVAAHAGDRSACRHAYERAMAWAETSGDRVVLIRLLTNLGSLENEEGRYDAALTWLDRALDLWRSDDGPMRCITAFNRAEALLAQGRLDEAIADLRSAQASARAVQAPLLAMAAYGLAEAYRLRGDAARAATAYREAADIAERTDQTQILGQALGGLARTTAVEDLEGAMLLAKRAASVPAALGRVGPLLALGWIKLLAGQTREAGEHAADAAREAGRRNDPIGLAEALELQALSTSHAPVDPVREAEGLWHEVGHQIGMADNALVLAAILHDEAGEQAARQTLQQLGVRDDATRIAGPRLAVRRRGVRPVAIRALGTFAVLVDDSPVPVSAWGSRKPRDALKVLVAGAGRRTTRDGLSEALWPGQEETGSRISVVLSTLRSVLDPEKTYEPDHFVLADRTTVRLNLEAVDLDTVAFESAAQQAMLVSEAGGAHDVASLLAAATAYTGDFLDEDHDQPWADATRERLAMLSREVRRRLGLRLSSTEPECAVPWLVGLLQDDPYDETCHLLLVATMLRLGRFGEARRAHRAYEAAMAELDVPATPYVEVAGQVRAARSGRER